MPSVVYLIQENIDTLSYRLCYCHNDILSSEVFKTTKKVQSISFFDIDCVNQDFALS